VEEAGVPRREPPNMGKQLANFIKILAAPAYGVYISQLTKYSRVGGSYYDFLGRGLLLTRKLLNQVFQFFKLKSSL
jgi:hypothetical protein